MKECCLDTWYETNVAIRMVTWELVRPNGGDAYSQDEQFPISYTCHSCGRKWNSYNKPYPEQCKECKRDVWKLHEGEFCTLRCKQQWELFQIPSSIKWINMKEVND